MKRIEEAEEFEFGEATRSSTFNVNKFEASSFHEPSFTTTTFLPLLTSLPFLINSPNH